MHTQNLSLALAPITAAWTSPADGRRGIYIARGALRHGLDLVDARNGSEPERAAKPRAAKPAAASPAPVTPGGFIAALSSLALSDAEPATDRAHMSTAEIVAEQGDPRVSVGGEGVVIVDLAPTATVGAVIEVVPEPEAPSDYAQLIETIEAAQDAAQPEPEAPAAVVTAAPAERRGGRKGDRKPGAKLLPPPSPSAAALALNKARGGH